MKTLQDYLERLSFFIQKRFVIFAIVTLLINISAFAQCWQSITANGGTAHAIGTDGTLWAWGGNGSHLGIGFTPGIASTNIPLQVGTDTDWLSVEDGENHTVALKTDGTLWSWGNNNNGALGDGTNIWKWSPVQIGTDTNWQSISAGSDLSLALKTDGTIWAWGLNNHGQLGDNNQYINKYIPTQIGTANNWMKIDAGLGHAGAIKSDGTLWCWGLNTNGQVGNGSFIDQLIPIQISTDTDWQLFDLGGVNSAAIKTDGSLWSWGANAQGQSQILTPVQVGAETNWSDVSSGVRFALGLKTNGTLFSWGDNANGQLGNGTLTSVYSPVQIGLDTNWQTIEAGLASSYGTKSDDTLWSWGTNFQGELGNGSFGTGYYNPVNVICGALSVDESFVDFATIYPNPTHGLIHLNTPQNTFFDIIVDDAFGRRIAQFQEVNSIDISNYNSGLYFLKLFKRETLQRVTRKIVKN